MENGLSRSQRNKEIFIPYVDPEGIQFTNNELDQFPTIDT